MAYKRAYFPMKIIYISQGYGTKSSSHKNSYALDLCGNSKQKESVYAPFDCTVTKIYKPKDPTKNATTIWLTSSNKVLCPNGYYGYLTMSITHPEKIMKIKLGQKYSEGEYMMSEGATGNATGNHIHLELSKGTKAGWKKVNGEYIILNKVKPENYLFVKESSTIKNKTYKKTTYNLIKESDITYKVTGVSNPPLNIHKQCNTSKNNIIGGLKNNDEVILFSKKNNMSYIYHYEKMGYVVSKYLKKE